MCFERSSISFINDRKSRISLDKDFQILKDIFKIFNNIVYFKIYKAIDLKF